MFKRRDTATAVYSRVGHLVASG
eukprot:COSAG02_NODE_30635_length_547_cov_2.136161_1_plen_22_part_01